MILFITTIKEYNYPTPQACRVVENVGSLVETLITREVQNNFVELTSLVMRVSTCDPTFSTTRRLRRRVVLYY